MSGGHWDHGGSLMRDNLEAIGKDPDVLRRWPALGELMGVLAQELYEIDHDLDWDLSCDTLIKDDKAWEKAKLAALLVATMKAAPDEWFPRGKWATIQAVQGRAEPEATP